MAITISQEFKTKWHRNPISGHEWSTPEPTKRLMVSGGNFQTTYHTKLETAEKEKALREGFISKFPFIMPRSEREIDNCKHLKIHA